MAVFKITIKDTENGNVRVDCTPDFEVLAKIARAKTDITPATEYVLGALAWIKNKSIQNLKNRIEEQSRNGTLPPIYDPETKLFT